MILAWLLAAFLVIPIVELAVLLQVGRWIGLPGTLMLVVLTGIAGAVLVKLEGLLVLNRMRGEMAAGRLPAPYLIDGVMILFAGALLLTPGLLTDAVGFALLIPAVRTAIRAMLRRKLEKTILEGQTTVSWSGPMIDVDVDDVEDDRP